MNYAICYVSTAAKELYKIEINQILELTEKKNNENDLSGILLYSDGNFFQVIEGEKDQVDEIFTVIKQDSRHFNIFTIFEKQISATNFEDYKVDFLTVSMRKDQKELQPYIKQIDKLNKEIRPSVRYIIRQFIDGI